MELGRNLKIHEFSQWKNIYLPMQMNAESNAHMHAQNKGFESLDFLRDSITRILIEYGRFNSLWN